MGDCCAEQKMYINTTIARNYPFDLVKLFLVWGSGLENLATRFVNLESENSRHV